MMRKDDEMDERLMSDEAVEDAVLRYLEESPEVVSGMAPSRDLWPGIEARIGTRVLPLGREGGRDGGNTVEVRSIRRRPPWLAMAAAAAFLVASTASVTYVVTRRLASPSTSATSPAQVATTQPASATPRGSAPAGESATAATPPEATSGAAVTPSRVASTVGSERTPRVAQKNDDVRERTEDASRMVAHEPAASLVRYPVTGSDEARVTYDDEIGRLHAVLESRRDQLDPTTVATVEQNLHVIDVAIEQARAALAKDPHSRMLNEQLDRTLAKKTQLLRAATLLPSA